MYVPYTLFNPSLLKVAFNFNLGSMRKEKYENISTMYYFAISKKVQIKFASPCSLLESLLKGDLNQMFVEYKCQFLNYSYCKIFTTSLLQGPSGPLAKST